MRTDVLRNFVALSDEKSMTRTAKRLHISQPTLSRQMSALEDDLGKQLYIREEGIIKLTVDGQILYDYATSIVELEDRARTAIAHSDEHVTGTVYIGHGDSNSMQYLFQAMSNVRERHRGVTFNLVSGDTHSLVEKLNQGSIDFMQECGARQRGRYLALPLPGQDTIAALVGPQSRLFGLEKVTPSDLAGEDLVVSKQLLESDVMRDWAGDQYPQLRSIVNFNLGMTVVDLAEYGSTCVIGYQELAERYYGQAIDCIPLDPPIVDESAIVWRKNRPLSPAAQAFLDALRAICAAAD
jgi:DNA-binding transcriptional LysR family regulator